MPQAAAPLITLTTDFGTQDWFVGTMKGVIAGLAPEARIIDLTHEIPPGDIRAGAFALAAACGYFPKGTVHLVVVDPGVGSARRALAIQTRDYMFVGPDNGVLSWALRTKRVLAAHAITNSRLLLRPVSNTFHGRDVFSPVAARLSAGLAIGELGPRLRSFARLTWPRPKVTNRAIRGEVIYVDRFGNAITNIDHANLRAPRRRRLRVVAGGQDVGLILRYYGAAPPGQALAVVGSSGLLEVAVNGGSAAETLGLRVGEAVEVRTSRR